MKTLKKSVSIFLCFVMLLTAVPFMASAGNTSNYVADYDTDTPIVILHGIGQNDTYIVDDEGNRLTDKEGGEMTGWPLELDVTALILEALPALLMSVITRRDAGLSEALGEGVYKALYAVHKDAEGNYEYNVEVPCYKCPMSEMPEDIKSMYYRRIPMQLAGEIVGEDNVYIFGYDSLGDVTETARLLHEFINETVLPQTGAEQVNLCPISMGGSVAVQYLDSYKEDYDLIKKIVYVVPAVDGSDIVGDLLTGNLSTYDDDTLYEKLLVTLMGDSFTTYLLNMVLRILPSDVLKQAVIGLADGAIEAAIRNSTQLWALCPTEYYAEAREKWLSDDAHAKLAAKVDGFMQARANFKANHEELVSKGVQVYDIVCYDLELFPLSKDYRTTNSDGIIQCESTSLGATFAELGTTFSADYVQAGTYCSEHNHLSPDGKVDPTTGLFPDTTWYFKGQSHEALQYNDVCLELATQIMTDDNMVDVYSNPEAYPQYNGARNIRPVTRNIEAWEKADKSGISADKIAAVETAIANCKALEEESVIDTAAYLAATDALESALVAAGVIESSEPSTLESIATFLTKSANKAVNGVFAYLEK